VSSLLPGEDRNDEKTYRVVEERRRRIHSSRGKRGKKGPHSSLMKQGAENAKNRFFTTTRRRAGELCIFREKGGDLFRREKKEKLIRTLMGGKVERIRSPQAT